MHPAVRHEPHPDHPGWWTWALADDDRYNATLGELLVRREGDGRARCRMFPTIRQSNLAGVMHGGATLTFIDMAMFAGGHVAGANIDDGVTLDLAAQFLIPGRIGEPLDCTVEVLRESKRLVFLRGIVEQRGEPVAAWSGALRKAAPPR